MIIGNAVTLLNDRGFHFRVQPPEVHTDPEGLKSSFDTEAVVMSFETPAGFVYLNIGIRYNLRRKTEREAALTARVLRPEREHGNDPRHDSPSYPLDRSPAGLHLSICGRQPPDSPGTGAWNNGKVGRPGC